MSIHCTPITIAEAPCSGQQTENILLSPAEKRSERTRPTCGECRTGLANTVGKREAKFGLKELFNVRPPDILRLFNLHHAKNLHQASSSSPLKQAKFKKKKYERELTGNEHGGEQPCPDKVT